MRFLRPGMRNRGAKRLRSLSVLYIVRFRRTYKISIMVTCVTFYNVALLSGKPTSTKIEERAKARLAVDALDPLSSAIRVKSMAGISTAMVKTSMMAHQRRIALRPIAIS